MHSLRILDPLRTGRASHVGPVGVRDGSLCHLFALSIAVPLLAATTALAQLAPVAPTAESARRDSDQSVPSNSEVKNQNDTIVMNPFVISTEGDVGYLAQSSLSGSRLNTNIADLAQPMTSFTAEFLADVGLYNVDDLSQFMTNTKTDYPEGDNLFKDADSARFQIRGLPAYNYAVNFFQTNLRLDFYNLEGVDQSRGPNSILFGIGSPGGLVNVTTKKAAFKRTFGSINQVVRDPEGWRTDLDYNQVIVPGKLSLRLDAVRDYKNTWRHREFDHQRRLYGTIGWQVSKNTRVDVEGEHGLVNKSLSQPMSVKDSYTPWRDAGKHVSDTANAAFRIASISAAAWNAIDTTTGQLLNWQGKMVGTAYNVGGTPVWLSDFSIVPKDIVFNAGAPFAQNTNYSRGSLFLTHAFTPNLNIEFAANAQKADRNAMAARGNILQVDASLTLPNGQPNPNSGRPFVDQFPGTTDSYNSGEMVRLSAAYNRDLGRWLGRHQFAVLYEKDWTWSQATQLRPAIVENPYNITSPTNGANSLRFRTYIDLDGPPDSIGEGDWRPFIVHSPGNIRAWDNFATTQVVDATTGRKMGVKWISNAVPGDNRFVLNSAMGILQSHFFNDRLVTVAGYRADRQNAWFSVTDAALALAPPYGSFTSGEFKSVPAQEPILSTAYNLTYSAVFRLTKKLSLTYNRSRNSSLADQNGTLVNPDGSGHVPAPRGVSQDIGIKLNLGNRLSLHLLHYETTAEKNTLNSNPTIEGRFPVIWAALDTAGIKGPDGGSALNVPNKFNRYTFHSVAKGYEFEVIANPTKDWRIFLNFSDNVVTQTNLGEEAIAYVDKYRSFWAQHGTVLVTAGSTVASELAGIDQNIANLYVLPDGQQGRGQVRHQVNLNTKYTFSTGKLKGFSIGGGGNYQSGQVVDYELAPAAGAVHGRSNMLVNLMLGYRGAPLRVRAHDIRWSTQFNITNLLNEKKMLPTRTIDGVVVTYRVQPPIQFMLSNKFSF
jgi:iron complex outermembrane recepter protein